MRFITMHSNSLVPQQRLAEYRLTTLRDHVERRRQA